MKLVISIFLLMGICLDISAQNGFISFEKTRVNLGRLSESQFPVTYTFEFLVAGSGEVSIASVDSDCACSAAEYSQNIVKAGNKGFVKVEFNPYKAGPFVKTFTVNIKNAIPKKTELIIEGFIKPFAFDSEIEFPATFSNGLALRHKYVLLGNITNSGLIKKNVQVYNFNSDTVYMVDSVASPPFMDVAFENGLAIPPKQIYSYSLFYDPSTKNDFGDITDSLTLFMQTDENKVSPLTLYVKSSIRQYFPEKLAEDNANSYPRLVASDTLINLGSVSLKKEKIVEFVLSNTGESPLDIQKIVCNYGAEIYHIDKRNIAPLGFAKLKIAVKDIKKKGTQDRQVFIYCNDPNNTVTSLRIKLKAQ